MVDFPISTSNALITVSNTNNVLTITGDWAFATWVYRHPNSNKAGPIFEFNGMYSTTLYNLQWQHEFIVQRNI